MQVGSWVFVHGGVLPAHVEYGLDRINRWVALTLTLCDMRFSQPACAPSLVITFPCQLEPPASLPLSTPARGRTPITAVRHKTHPGNPRVQEGNHRSNPRSRYIFPTAQCPNHLPRLPHPTALNRSGNRSPNSETKAWLLGDAGPGAAAAAPGSAPPTPPQAPSFLRGASAIVWARAFSATDERRCDCDTLQSVLQVGACVLAQKGGGRGREGSRHTTRGYCDCDTPQSVLQVGA